MSNLRKVINKATKNTIVFKLNNEDIYFSRLADIEELVSEDMFKAMQNEFFSRMKLVGKSYVVDESVPLTLFKQVCVVGNKSENDILIDEVERRNY